VRHEADLEEAVAVLTHAERAALVSLLRKLGRSLDGSAGETGVEEAS